MSQIRVRHDIGDLADDIVSIARQAKKDMHSTVREGLRVGNVVARDFARQSSGRHAKDYPKTFSSEMHGALSAITGGDLISGEYGPEAHGQGLLPLERGNRNTKPHLDLARSADLLGPSFAGEVGRLPEHWFW